MSHVNVEAQEFHDLLVNHDWFYDYSDDHRVWQKGRKQAEEIRQVIQSFPEFEAIYNAYQRNIFGTS